MRAPVPLDGGGVLDRALCRFSAAGGVAYGWSSSENRPAGAERRGNDSRKMERPPCSVRSRFRNASPAKPTCSPGVRSRSLRRRATAKPRVRMTASRPTRESRGKRSPCEDDGVDVRQPHHRPRALARSHRPRSGAPAGAELVLRGLLKRSSARNSRNRAAARRIRDVALGRRRDRRREGTDAGRGVGLDVARSRRRRRGRGARPIARDVEARDAASALIGAGSAVLGMQIAAPVPRLTRAEVDALVERAQKSMPESAGIQRRARATASRHWSRSSVALRFDARARRPRAARGRRPRRGGRRRGRP